jgi:hypothetical protein
MKTVSGRVRVKIEYEVVDKETGRVQGEGKAELEPITEKEDE